MQQTKAKNLWIIRSTFASKDEALLIARTLLEEGLIACANLGENVTSLFHWEGTIQQEQEAIALFKTNQSKASQVIARIRSLHSYQIPSIFAWPAELASEAFVDWVNTEVR